MRTLTAALVAALIAAGCGGSQEDVSRVPDEPPGRPAYGFNDNSVRAGLVSPERQARLLAGAGARVARLTLDWRFAERSPGVYDLAVYDRIYRALRRRGVRPLWTVMFAPRWAWDPGARCSGDCRLPPSRAAEDRYAAFVAEVARRYPRSAGIEVWNEPNLVTFWQPRPDARRYARLLVRAHSAVKRVAPRMPVAGGALSNNRVTDDRGNVAMTEFLDGMYRHGAKGSFDVLSFHPYPVSRSNPLLLPSVAGVLEVLERRKDARRPLWVTELGATVNGTDPDLRFDEREQAEVLSAGYCRLARVPAVRMVLVHTLIAPPGPGESAAAGYALLRPDRSRRPALRALAEVARNGCPRGGE